MRAEPLEAADKRKSEAPYFVVSARSVYHRNGNLLPFAMRKKLHIVPKQYDEEIDRFKDDVADLTERMIERFQCRAKFLCTYVGRQMSAADDAFTADILSRIDGRYRDRIETIDVNNTPSENKAILGRARFIVSVPLHPLILGASEYVPVYSLSYASKSKCFMEQIGREAYVYPVEKIGDRLDVQRIAADIEREMTDASGSYREKLRAAVDRSKAAELRNGQLLLELLNRI